MISAQLQTALVEADPAQDRAFRRKAEEFYDKLLSWLKAQDSMKKYRSRKWNAYPGVADAYSYEVTSKVIGFDQEYPEFAVWFSPFRTGTASFGKRGRLKVINMPVLTADALQTESGHEMGVNLGWVREIFIHEFIHYLDDLRYKGKPTVASAALKKKGGEAAYFNSPAEFNAYFQGGASDIEKHAAEMKPGQFERKYGRPGTGFKKFRKDFEHIISKSFRKALKDEWKRKYEVRLWQLHQDLLARSRGLE
jgi:hypothetical protein